MAQTPQQLMDRVEGRSATQIALEGGAAYVLALVGAAINGLQTVTEFLLLPLTIMTDIAFAAADAFFLEVFGITSAGAAATELALQQFQLFGLPVSVALALGTMAMIAVFLSLGITSNFLPGFILDSRLLAWFTTTPEEEAEGED